MYTGGPLANIKKWGSLWKFVLVLILYGISIGILAAYSALINTETKHKLVGLIVSVAIVIFDLLWLFMAWQDSQTNPMT